MKKSVDVITHISIENLGNILHVLEELPFAIQYFQAGINNFSQVRHNESDLLIVLGGPIGVYQKDDYPFLQEELDIIKARFDKNLATLGICLGAQLMAEALGGRAYKGDAAELGWHRIQTEQSLADNPLCDFHDTHVVQWHGDTYEMPPSAERLASSPSYQNQAFRIGDKFLALQFHPEITEEGLERWYIAHVNQISNHPNLTVQQLRQDTSEYLAGQHDRARALWRSWLQKAVFSP